MTLLARRAGRLHTGGWHAADRPVASVRELAELLRSYDESELHDAVNELRDHTEDGCRGQTADERRGPTADADDTWTVRAAAVVVEAFRRVRGIDLFDTQILAGLILTDRPVDGRGYVAEMQTGEGKTFAAAFPAVALALHGRGVHVATSNKYLADRDAELLRPIYECLDLSVAALPEATDGGTPALKVEAYQADITYGPGYEFGFDYLRDQLARRDAAKPRPFADRYRNPARAERTQRPLFAAVIDEVDHVLLDDASSPLVLAVSSGEEAVDAGVHRAARALVLTLDEEDITTHDAHVELTDRGRDKAYTALQDNFAALLRRPWLDYVTQAAHAEHVFRRDVHYVLDEEDKVQIIDPSTGRIFADRTWSDGLHQAVECKESLPIRDANRTLARVTRQRFSGLYQRLCGMTGTATGSEREFAAIYGLDVESVPTRLPSQRFVGPLHAFGSAEERWHAVVDEVRALHTVGRPVLVGTTSIAASETIAARLTEVGLTNQLLNGRQDADEADVVAQAGGRGAITVATGIAGRGTDIALTDDVRELGGLHVIVAEAQPSARVERQLIGRAARQGDPGSASRYVSADDPYLVKPAPWLADRMRRGHLHVEAAVRRVQRTADRAASKSRIALWTRDGERDDLVARLAD